MPNGRADQPLDCSGRGPREGPAGKVAIHCVNTRAQADALIAAAEADAGPAGKRNASKLTPKGLEKE
jgi:hypothetical protein